jgi:integrase
MIYKKKGSRYYMVKFKWQGKTIRKSTRATNQKTARSIEGKIRSELAQGNWGILERKPKPVLAEFLNKSFLPFVQATFKNKPATLTYYEYGTKYLLSAGLAKLPIDEITDQQAKEFVAQRTEQSASTINCGLRTLRRALNLAVEWGVMDRAAKIRLAKGEKQRERVLSEAERKAYLAACRQPWKDIATIFLGTGMRPGEVHVMRWENVLIEGEHGFINILQGKSKAARRMLPMVPEVLKILKRRFEEQARPSEGWVFPAETQSGHTEEDALKRSHKDALRDSKVAPFPPYCLRHTALTDLGTLGCDAFTLARIAGHSSIAITQRYIHPQADAIERAFAEMAGRKKVVTDGGHPQIEAKNEES